MKLEPAKCTTPTTNAPVALLYSLKMTAFLSTGFTTTRDPTLVPALNIPWNAGACLTETLPFFEMALEIKVRLAGWETYSMSMEPVTVNARTLTGGGPWWW